MQDPVCLDGFTFALLQNRARGACLFTDPYEDIEQNLDSLTPTRGADTAQWLEALWFAITGSDQVRVVDPEVRNALAQRHPSWIHTQPAPPLRALAVPRRRLDPRQVALVVMQAADDTADAIRTLLHRHADAFDFHAFVMEPRLLFQLRSFMTASMMETPEGLEGIAHCATDIHIGKPASLAQYRVQDSWALRKCAVEWLLEPGDYPTFGLTPGMNGCVVRSMDALSDLLRDFGIWPGRADLLRHSGNTVAIENAWTWPGLLRLWQ